MYISKRGVKYVLCHVGDNVIGCVVMWRSGVCFVEVLVLVIVCDVFVFGGGSTSLTSNCTNKRTPFIVYMVFV